MADLISRAAALEVISAVKSITWPQSGKVLCGKMYSQIKDLPAVDAVPVVYGNWIECYERSRHYYCSNCGKVQGIASIVMKYCPECGAKMAEHPWSGRCADQSGAEYADNPTV